MKKVRLKKKNCIIALLVLLFILFELINPFKIIAVNKLVKMGYSRETSNKIVKLGLKNNVLNNEFSPFIEKNIISDDFDLNNYSLYAKIDYNEKTNMANVNTLINKNYSTKDISLILKRKGNVDYLLQNTKIDNLSDYLIYDYANIDYLSRYIDYKSKNDVSYEDAVTFVNIGLDKTFYEDYKEINEFSYTMLVNKYNKLGNNFTPPELVSFPSEYCHGTCPEDNKTVVEAFVQMAEALKEEKNLKIYVNSAYRSFDNQEETYNRLIKAYGPNYDVAKAGFSEHQTGLSVDIGSGSSDTFKGSKEAEWLKDNAYKYGFIFRYSSDKTKITGYNEPWHYRYVGDIAKDIYEKNITFDEYYVKYLDK